VTRTLGLERRVEIPALRYGRDDGEGAQRRRYPSGRAIFQRKGSVTYSRWSLFRLWLRKSC